MKSKQPGHKDNKDDEGSVSPVIMVRKGFWFC